MQPSPPSIHLKNFSIVQQETLYPLSVHPSLPHNIWQTSFYFLSQLIWLFLTPHMGRIIEYFSFCVWFSSLACFQGLFRLQHYQHFLLFIVCIDHILFAHSSVHLSYFYLLLIRNNAAKNTAVQMSVSVFSLGYILRSELLHLMVIQFYFPCCLYQYTIPQALQMVSSVSTACPVLVLFCIFFNNHSNVWGGIIVSYCTFPLPFVIFFGEMSTESLSAHFWIGYFGFLWLTCRVLHIFWMLILYLVYD
jgi:hypothetical protein